MTENNVLENHDVKQVVGAWYDSCNENDILAERAYRVIARVNAHFYDQIPIPVEWTKEDPYDSYADMRETVAKEGKLRVFSGGTEPEHMSHAENVKGRAVHDYFGHLEADCDFSMAGEWTKFNHVKDRYPAWVRPLLFTEIVGQRAAASYYTDGFGDENFEQKAAFAPQHIREMCRRAYKNRGDF